MEETRFFVESSSTMNRIFTAKFLGLVGVLLGAGWLFSTPVDQQDTANPASMDTEVSANAGLSAGEHDKASKLGRASFGFQSPFGYVQYSSAQPDQVLSGDARARTQFVELVQKYSSGEMSSEGKLQIKKSLRELKLDPTGRALIIDTFFAADQPQLAEDLYGLIRDADLKDVALLEGLIQRGSAKASTPAATRIMDLIADLGTQDGAPYSGLIDGYLAQVALNSDTTLRTTAVSQRIWYLAQHQSTNLAVLANYLVDAAPTVREEMYSLIESRIANQTLSGQAALTLALNSALQSDNLGVSEDERARVSVLLQTLSNTGGTLLN